MNALKILGVFNYGLVLLYGLFLSTAIAGGLNSRRQRLFILALCPIFLAIQTPCWLLLGSDTVKQIYPLIVHLPLMLTLIFGLKKPIGITIISVCTAYLCCQLPRFCNIVVTKVSESALVGEIAYTILIVPIYFLLRRFFTPAAYNAMIDSKQSLLLLGSLPVIYYVFDYITAIYTDLLYEGIRTIVEAIPSMLILFYVAFLTLYHHQIKERNNAELAHSLLDIRLKQMEGELDTLRRLESQSALYRHDMRHHLIAISGFLSEDKSAQAQAYIQEVQADIENITPKRFCENEMVNLLCSSYAARAENMEVRLTVKADLPRNLSISDTSLCALLSNGLENALNAAAKLEEAHRYVSCSCCICTGKLLIEIKNPYTGTILIKDNLPVSNEDGHGYGCHSIQAITQAYDGLCQFEAENGIFILRAALPIC